MAGIRVLVRADGSVVYQAQVVPIYGARHLSRPFSSEGDAIAWQESVLQDRRDRELAQRRAAIEKMHRDYPHTRDDLGVSEDLLVKFVGLWEPQKCGSNECWPWLDNPAGRYGDVSLTVNGRLERVLTNRLALLVTRGVAPIGKPLALHDCDNPPCSNDGHLNWGNQSDNVRAMFDRHRNPLRPVGDTCKNGHLFDRPPPGNRCSICVRSKNVSREDVFRLARQLYGLSRTQWISRYGQSSRTAQVMIDRYYTEQPAADRKNPAKAMPPGSSKRPSKASS